MTEVYFADVTPLSELSRYERLLASLSEARKAKAIAYKVPRDRALSAGASYLLAEALRRRGINEVSVNYSHSEHGKPFIAGHESSHFSLSHSGSLAMCAISDVSDVGCDVEITHRFGSAIARRFFCESELRHITGSADADAEFTRLWTLKESYIKWRGMGLACPLSSFEVIPALPVHIAGEASPNFAEFVPAFGYRASVCTDDAIAADAVFVSLESI